MAKTRELSALRAGDIMQTEVVTVSVTTPLADVECLLSDRRITGVPVTNEAGHIVGVISMRDLIECYAESPSARERRQRGFYEMADDEELDEVVATLVPSEAEETAGDVMTAQVHSVDREASLTEVAKRMFDLKVHRILVEDAGKHVGLISTFDILRALASSEVV